MGNAKKRKLVPRPENVANGHATGKINGHVEGIFDPMAVTWTEKYNENIERVWGKLPKFLKTFIATAAIALLGIGISGDWLNIIVHAIKQFSHNHGRSNSSLNLTTGISLESLKLSNLPHFFIGASIVGYALYFGIGGFLHWYFYVRRREKAEEWKCQPKKWMSPDLEKHEILFGSFNLLVNSTTTSILACYISNGGYSTIYYNFDDYPWWWLILQFPVIFIYQDYSTYLLHRLYHTPFLYKHFHKMHHKYKQPTAFSVTAIHPLESTHIQLTLILPIFLIPVHWGPFYIIAIYTYYHGIIDHSGINFKAFWWQPWQPDAIFHDNHHQYFHVNFGFNIYFWDILHGTYRRKDRFYTEEIFYGRGKAITEATKEELQTDIDERLSENPLAYRGNKLEFELTQRDLKFQKKAGKNRKR